MRSGEIAQEQCTISNSNFGHGHGLGHGLNWYRVTDSLTDQHNNRYRSCRAADEVMNFML